MRYLNAILVIVLLFHQSAYSTEYKNASGLTVRSTESTFDDQKGIIVFNKNVVITNNNIELKADKVIGHRKNGELTKIEIFGSPVKFKRKGRQKKVELSGTAIKAVYFKSGDKLVLYDYSLNNLDGIRIIGKKGNFLLKEMLTSR